MANVPATTTATGTGEDPAPPADAPGEVAIPRFGGRELTAGWMWLDRIEAEGGLASPIRRMVG